MSRARKRRDPDAPLRRRVADLTAVELPAELATLPSGAMVQVDRSGPANALRARRVATLDRLCTTSDRAGTARRVAALERLSDLLAQRHGEDGDNGPAPRVDRSGRPAEPTERMLSAGDTITGYVMGGGRPIAMLVELSRPSPLDWRAIVVRHSGERNEDVQGAVVRMAADLLSHLLQGGLDRPGEAGAQPLGGRFATTHQIVTPSQGDKRTGREAA